MTISAVHEHTTTSDEWILDPRPRWRRLLAPSSVVAGLALGTLYVAKVDPNQPGHHPPCPLKFVTGLDCPGCGGLRATHDLANGNIVGAFDHNALLVVLLPVIAFFLGRWLFRAWTGRKPVPTERSRVISQRLMQVLVIALVAFSVLRNVPLLSYFGSA